MLLIEISLLFRSSIILEFTYDGKFPEEYLQTYLDYFELSNKEFDIIIDKWANKKLFVKKDNFWIPKFNIE